MSVFLAILPILGALIPFVLKEITRFQEAHDDPKNQNKARYEAIDKAIAKSLTSGNSDALTTGGGADLDELDRLQRAASRGSQQ
jgi:hypothetical protein